MKTPATPVFWDEAKDHLSRNDGRLKLLIAKYPQEEKLISRGAPFETLLRSIVGQQISVKAADSIWKRFAQAGWPMEKNPSPGKIQSLRDLQFRSSGISPQKIKYIRDLTKHFLDETLKPSLWKTMSDEDVIADLCQVKGIGPWTAQMFSIFHLHRPDILPLADLGLQKAASLLYKKPYPMNEKILVKLAKPWAPFRSVATWYLWRSLDPIPVEY